MSRRRVLVTGGAGLVGSALCRSAPGDVALTATVRSRPAPPGIAGVAVDLSDPDAVGAVFAAVRPDLVIHTAYSLELQRDIEAATAAVAAACRDHSAVLVHLSTDAVFDGEHAPYDEAAIPHPAHDYGRAKLAAEAAVLAAVPDATIVRTSLVVHPAGTDGASEWLLADLASGRPVTLFRDEFRCPILVDDLAAMLWELAALPAGHRSGVWHLVGPERLSRVDIGRLWCAARGHDPSLIVSALSSDLPVPRPRDLTLTSERAGSLSVRPRPIGSVIGHGQET